MKFTSKDKFIYNLLHDKLNNCDSTCEVFTLSLIKTHQNIKYLQIFFVAFDLKGLIIL